MRARPAAGEHRQAQREMRAEGESVDIGERMMEQGAGRTGYGQTDSEMPRTTRTASSLHSLFFTSVLPEDALL
eukprot:ctg_13.g2